MPGVLVWFVIGEGVSVSHSASRHGWSRSGTLTAGDSVVAAVPEDASLDQFVTSEATDSEDDEVDSADAGTGSEGAEPEVETETGVDPDSLDASAVDPAVSTYRWSSEGGECADCGASADRLWRGEGQKDGDLVCPDCKEW